MPEVSAASSTLVRHMLLRDAGEPPEPALLAEAAERAAARLRGRLAGLIGMTGYTILVARAVRLAQADVPTLAGITVDASASGVLHGIHEFARTSAEPDVAAAGLIALLSHVIELLSTFIGEDLAVRLVREAWPDLAHGPVQSEEQQ